MSFTLTDAVARAQAGLQAIVALGEGVTVRLAGEKLDARHVVVDGRWVKLILTPRHTLQIPTHDCLKSWLWDVLPVEG